MIKAFGSEHSAAINDLAQRGEIKPVEFTVNGVRHTANSVWAATDWLKANGHYDAKAIIVWHLEA